MAACSTVTGQTSVVTSYITSDYVATLVTTAPPQTVATSSPVLFTSCVAATVVGELPVCATATSFAPSTAVLPGSTVTVSRTLQTVVPVVQTVPGAVSTVCQAPVSSSSAPSPTVEPVQRTSSTTTLVTTTLTTTPSAAPAETAAVRPSTTLPSDSSTAEAEPSAHSSTHSSPSSTSNVLVTSYRTVVVTAIDSAGHTSIYESAVPTLLNAPSFSSSAKSNAGAIAGGTVGGVAALALLALLFFLGRKRFFRRGDDEIEEDVWAPKPHGDFYAVGAAAGGSGSGGGGGSGGGSTEDKLDALSEKDRAVDAATLERHRSWYNSLSGHGRAEEEMDEVGYEGAYGGMVPARVPSPGPNAVSALPYAYEGAAGTVAGEAAAAAYAAGAAPRRSASNRLSVYSGSSHSHDGHGVGYSPQSWNGGAPLPPVPDYRLSLQQGYFQNFAPLPAGSAEYHQEELGGVALYPGQSPPPGAFIRPRSVSPPPPATPFDYPPPHRHPSPPASIARRPSVPSLAIPAHLRSNSYGARPTLEAIQHGRFMSGESSPSAGPSRMPTNDSFSSSSPSSPHSLGSGSLPSRPATGSSSRHVTPPSTAAPTAPTTPAAASSDADKQLALPFPSTLPVMPSIERLKALEASSSPSSPSSGPYPKRPPMDRAASSESFIVPSQWLGARVVNADAAASQASLTSAGSEAEETLDEAALASVDSLGLAKGEMVHDELPMPVVAP